MNRKAVDEKSKVVDFTNAKIVSISDQKTNQSLLEDKKKWRKSSETVFSSNVKCEEVSDSQMSPLLCWEYAGLVFSNYLIETLSESGFKIGPSRAMASKLAAMTVHSATQVMLKFGRHPNELMDEMRLSSEATNCDLHILDKTGVASVVSAAFESLRKRFDKFSKI